MSNVLQHQGIFTSYDMMLSLKEMFEDLNRAVKFFFMRDLMNTTMIEGTLVRDHILKMISFLNDLDILGSEIDGKTQVDIILQSLPDFLSSST